MMLLVDLKAVHAELRTAMAALQAETARAVPDEERLAAVRLHLIKVSNRRRLLIECAIYPSLHAASAADRRAISELQLAETKARVASSAHIARWTMRAILADWPGYQRAAAAMLLSMRGRIAEELAILYPLLATDPHPAFSAI